MIHMSLDCVIPTQSSVIQTIHCNVGLTCFFLILPKCLLLSLYTVFHKKPDPETSCYNLRKRL